MQSWKNFKINLFNKWRNWEWTCSDSICRINWIVYSNIHIPKLVKENLNLNTKKCSQKLTELMLFSSYRVTQLLIFISWN